MFLRTSSREISVMKITKQYISGYSPFCFYLITKESYNWWITRRKRGFRHQIFEAKNLKMLVANIWKHSEGFRRCTRWLRNWPSAWCDRVPMALTSSFQLRFMHYLKCWISAFLSFEMTYSMHEMHSSKCSKYVQ